MITLTTLPLAGGQRGDGGSGRQEGRDGTPSFVKNSPADAVLASEHVEVFDVFVKLKLVTINHLQLKLFYLYQYILKSVEHASRGESPDSVE